ESGTNPYLVHEDLQEIMNRYVNIVRTKEELETALEKLEEIKKDEAKVKASGTSQYNPGWHEALSLQCLIISAEAVTRGGLLREESRGAHTRIDFPGESNEWMKYWIVSSKNNDSSMKTEKIIRPEAPKELEEISFPPMMLITLVENAIKHGLNPTAAGGRIDIFARLHGGVLEVEVSDTGVGFQASSGHGIGLANIRSRLTALYGGQAQLTLEPRTPNGVSCLIRVPYEQGLAA
ncbi:MAG: ATP-binding protein, partial [Betaproteobacteria bacterium]